MILNEIFIKLFFMGMIFVVFSCATIKDENYALIETKKGKMIVKFFPDIAPKHVESFKALIEKDYFNGTTFHRVIPGFVIQGGDPNSKDNDRFNDGMGGHAGKYFGIGDENNSETWTVPAEFNEKPHKRGILSMARSQNPDSGGSQFFICVDNVPQLDNNYTVFGEVISGLEVIDKIVNSSTPGTENPSYRGPDRDNPLEKVEMNISLISSSELDLESLQ
tara:strand:- start:5687 stop:6346 length:660 start_codon:yes stop_codon:yes gene_type:complete